MPGPATYASDVSVAERARAVLEETAGRVSAMESAQRELIESLLELWPISGWKAAGVRSAKQWLKAHTASRGTKPRASSASLNSVPGTNGWPPP